MPNFRTLFAFPFGIGRYGSTAAAGGYDLAVPITLDEAMAIYWRVRTWRVTATRQTPGHPAESYDFVVGGTTSSETDLMRPYTLTGSQSDTYTESEGADPLTVLVSATIAPRTVFYIGAQLYWRGFDVSSRR